MAFVRYFVTAKEKKPIHDAFKKLEAHLTPGSTIPLLLPVTDLLEMTIQIPKDLLWVSIAGLFIIAQTGNDTNI